MKNKLQRFMEGRYGPDALTKFIVYVALGWMVIGLLFHQQLFYNIAMFLLVIGYFRMFSKNISTRYKENAKFCNLRNRIFYFFKARKTHHIYKCPTCKQKIRIPKGKGTIEITCPNCNMKFRKRS